MIRGWGDVRAAVLGTCVGVLAFVIMVLLFAPVEHGPPPVAEPTPVTFGTTVVIPPLCEQLPTHC